MLLGFFEIEIIKRSFKKKYYLIIFQERDGEEILFKIVV
jgi:hypothetical protein